MIIGQTNKLAVWHACESYGMHFERFGIHNPLDRSTVGWTRCANSPPQIQHKFSMFENRYRQWIVLHNPCCCVARKQFVLKLEFKSSSTDAAQYSTHPHLPWVLNASLFPVRTCRYARNARTLPVVTSVAHIHYSIKHKTTGCWMLLVNGVCVTTQHSSRVHRMNWGRDLCYVF